MYRPKVKDPIWHRIWNKINYFGDNSCLHGVGYVFSMKQLHMFKRLFWLAMLILCMWGASFIMEPALKQQSKSPVSDSVEATYLDWDTPFPAVTVCENMDVKRPLEYLMNHTLNTNLKSFLKEVGYWSSSFCGSCKNCVENQTCLHDFEKLVLDFRYKCGELMSQCSWAGHKFPCCERFLPIETELGVCYVFNSMMTGNDTATLLQLNRRVGLLSLEVTVLVKVVLILHSSDEVVTTSSRNKEQLYMGNHYEMIINAEQTVSDTAIQTIPVSRRRCLLKWERPAHAQRWPLTFSRYTYSACQWYCRAMRQVQLCNCSHHFVPKMDGINHCTVTGLGCLAEKLQNFSSFLIQQCPLQCPMECNAVFYKIIHVFNRKLPEAKGYSKALIRFNQLPSLRVRRQVIRNMLSFVVDIGGVGGVFFGASLLSIIEIFYLFFIRRQ